jgi:hypothetical protein
MQIAAGDCCESRDRDAPGAATFAYGFGNRGYIPRADPDRFGGPGGSLRPCPSLRDPALRKSPAMGLRVRICRDVFGTWSVHGLSPLPLAHLPSLSAAFDHARRKCGAAPATIELLIDGFYVVVHQQAGWPRPPLALETDQRRLVGRSAIAASYNDDTASAARSRPSWFIKWRASAMRSIAALASGFAAIKRSKSVLLSTSSRQ